MTKMEIFKTGKHTAMSGQTLEFGESDLQATASAYDPALSEAPLVIGHPQLDGPAYGWVKSLDYADGSLNASPHQVDESFAEMVRAGRFKKLSASFYLPDAPKNPVPGIHYLRHVGFLGAAPPSVKGLKPVSFADDEGGYVSFGDWADQTNAGLWRGIREWIISKFGLEEADQAVPAYGVSTLEDDARTPEETGELASSSLYSEPTSTVADGVAEPEEGLVSKEQELLDKETQLNQKEASFAEREAAIAQRERVALHAEHVTFAEGLVQAGKMLPANKGQVVALLDCLAADSNPGVVEFGERKSPAETLKDLLANQPKIVEFAEVSAGAAAPAGNTAGAKIETLVKQKLAANKDLAYSVAFADVQKEHPDLATEYVAELKGGN